MIDLGSATVLPGMIDTHLHIMGRAMSSIQLQGEQEEA